MSERTIGFDRKIELTWLDTTARLVAEGMSPSEVKERLEAVLAGDLGERGERSARSKTITVLRKIWSKVPEALRPFRGQALQLLPTLGRRQQIAIHWGMCAAAYPLLTDVAESTGRLLRLQGSVGLSQIERRMMEKYGERETLHYAVQRIIHSFVNWEVLQRADERGVYQATDRIDLTDVPTVEGWLLKALLISSGGQMVPFDTLAGSPALFPFDMDATPHCLKGIPGIEVARQGLDHIYVNWTQNRDKHSAK
jgi:hypothetical protein